MKKCKTCNAELPIEFFKTEKRKKGEKEYYYTRPICRGCYTPVQREATRRWREKENNKKSEWIKLTRKRAIADNVPFDISEEDVLVPEYCPVFNVKLERGAGKVHRWSPSLDKIIPELGYIKGNVQVISYLANTMKQNASPEELKLFAEWILREQLAKKIES